MIKRLSGILPRGIQWLRQRFVPGPRVLLYHRVTALGADPQLLAVTPRHFAEHLAILREKAFPMTLPALVDALQQGTVPRNAVVITFDDGYADNLYQAKPLLERYAVPATVFVASGSLGTREEFWWDELDRLLLQPNVLPAQLQLTVSGRTLHWNLGAAAFFTVQDVARYSQWSVNARQYPSIRHQAYAVLCAALRPLPPAERQQVLEQLRQWASATTAGRRSHRALTGNEITQLAAGELIEIGAHTVTHAYLSSLTADAQQSEILDSQTQLEQIIGKPVKTFSYPFGTRASYDTETLRIVHEAGFTCACANIPDLVTSSCDPWQLPRVLVRDWDGETFSRRFAAWLH